jgi:hypothetical protein
MEDRSTYPDLDIRRTRLTCSKEYDNRDSPGSDKLQQIEYPDCCRVSTEERYGQFRRDVFSVT